jgi:hypothetical protein
MKIVKAQITWGFILIFNILAFCQVHSQSKMRVLLIPLDDRPPCLQFPIKMGQIAAIELITPPRELLGRFTDFGKTTEIITWINTQNLQSFDAAIISIDMLAYGGLVASRVHQTGIETAMNQVKIIEEIRKKNPKLSIYGSSVIMRLAPTGDGKNEAYREKLARWAEVSPDVSQKTTTQILENEIPAEALTNYKKARERNLNLNAYAIELTNKKVFHKTTQNHGECT